MSTEYLTVEHLSRKDLARIFSKIKIDPAIRWNGTPCWVWTACKSKGGYGSVGWNKTVVKPYRLLYAWAIAPIAKYRQGGEIDHLCRNPPCCNPVHLEFVPSQVNVHRGFNPAGINARKIHCKRGHELSGNNLRVYTAASGKRQGHQRRICRSCLKQDQVEYHQAIYASKNAYHEYRKSRNAYQQARRARLKLALPD